MRYIYPSGITVNQNVRYLAPNRPVEKQHGMVGSLQHPEGIVTKGWREDLTTASFPPSAARLALHVSLFCTYLDFFHIPIGVCVFLELKILKLNLILVNNFQ